MGALNKQVRNLIHLADVILIASFSQIALLEKEVKAMQESRAKAMEAGQQKPGLENAIQFTIKYPGSTLSCVEGSVGFTILSRRCSE